VYCKFLKSSGVAILNSYIEVADYQIAKREESSECPALLIYVLSIQYSTYHKDTLPKEWKDKEEEEYQHADQVHPLHHLYFQVHKFLKRHCHENAGHGQGHQIIH
jgi:hypothetical protein